jgi:hypothetical protein
MHLQQTKVESRATGGPQYYFHSVDEDVKKYLRREGACSVVLHTPYGIAPSPFLAVGRDHKIDTAGRAVRGNVGHDRIQQGEADKSIGEEIRDWYGLKQGADFERIDVDVRIYRGHFILRPLAVKFRSSQRVRELSLDSHPLSYNRIHQSGLWQAQIKERRNADKEGVVWAKKQINRVVQAHPQQASERIHEADLLRAAGALSVLGMELGPYLTSGYDCAKSLFCFANLPAYSCPVEIKKSSRGFSYQVARYDPLPRVVVLCVRHDYRRSIEDVDFIELSALADALPG